ncbi:MULTISPECIES: TIGR03943 family protein [unclassified Treponema]|uniref:TIGR03943 family putative permease subunit n=1 Tax=unclassified Treponema TaxID=2638727 RepID=UPI000ADB6148|nr:MULTISPECIES: TIGR03943 family protein [unclassified Treponema]
MIKQYTKNTRFQDMVQTVILFGFALYFIGVVVSGSVYRYVHERHIPVLLLSAAVFFIIGILKFKQVIQESQRHTSLHTSGYSAVVFDRPVGDVRSGRAGVFGIAVFAVALVGMSAALGTVVRFSQFAYTGSLGEGTAGSSITAAPVAALPSAGDARASASSGAVLPSVAVSPTEASSATSAIAERNIPSADGGIVMDSDTFAQWLTKLYTKPDAWVGKKITATGSVWKDGELFEKDEFALARMMMTCCAADMQPVGVLAQWSDVQALTEGEWIEVIGTLSKKPYKDSFDPLIIVETVKKIEPPQREYIYP